MTRPPALLEICPRMINFVRGGSVMSIRRKSTVLPFVVIALLVTLRHEDRRALILDAAAVCAPCGACRRRLGPPCFRKHTGQP